VTPGGGRADGGPLRVGLVCPYSFDRPGGVQNHVLGLAGHLRDAGHQPAVLGPGTAADLADPDLADVFTSAGTAVPVRYNGSVARVNFGPLSAARVRRWLAAGDFDVLHLHEPVTPSVAMLALRAAEVPVVATFHTATPRSRSMQLAGGALRGTIDKIGAGIAVSEPARRVVVRYLRRDAAVIPNGFRVADFPGPRRPPAPWRGGRHPRLVFLGRVEEPRKGLDVLLAALPAIRAAHPDLEVVVAGHGQRALPSHVRREDGVTDARKAELLATADVFVAPHTARESFGIVLLEAMASGAPLVASDLPAFTALLQADLRAPGRELGTVFPAGDHRALATAVAAVLDRPDPARVARGQEHARRFDWTRVGPEVVEVYRGLVEPRQLAGVARRRDAS
jgi:phosphatidyl-myo-inositol alpha-mannosyltransferase